MSRISYSDDPDYPGQFELWQANCRRSLKGKAGQAALRELETALLALPEKRLIAEQLFDDEGEVCAIGALAKHKGQLTDDLRAWGEREMEEVGVHLGMPRLVAWKVVELNDFHLTGSDLVTCAGPYRWPAEKPKVWVPITAESRYQQILAWVQRQLKTANQKLTAFQIQKVRGK